MRSHLTLCTQKPAIVPEACSLSTDGRFLSNPYSFSKLLIYFLVASELWHIYANTRILDSLKVVELDILFMFLLEPLLDIYYFSLIYKLFYLLFYLLDNLFINNKTEILNPDYTLDSPGSGELWKNTGTWNHRTSIKSESLGGKPDQQIFVFAFECDSNVQPEQRNITLNSCSWEQKWSFWNFEMKTL